MRSNKNRQVWLTSRPNGIPQATDFAIREVGLPQVPEGKFLVHNRFLSVDPAMRGWIADQSNYWPRIEVGDTMRAFAAGEVVESRHPGYAVGPLGRDRENPPPTTGESGSESGGHHIDECA